MSPNDIDLDTYMLCKNYANRIATASVSLPKTGDKADHGTAGQFAVSDGKGGITWKTLVEAEAVSY